MAIVRDAGINMVLVTGKEFLELMYEHNVGFIPEKIIEIKRVDKIYFSS